MDAPALSPEGLLAPGSEITLENCHREPIATPGGVQPHGALLVLDARTGVVVQHSANAAERLGLDRDPAGLALVELVGAPDAAALLAAAPGAGSDGGPAGLRPRRVRIGAGAVDAVAYPDGDGTVVLELEPAGADAAAVELVDDLSGLLAALTGAESIDGLLEAAAAWARRLTGFDRVWVYRFEPDGHGVVVAEETAADLELGSFLGLHFPARDIPPQARALFLENRVRVIPDVGAEPSPLVPLVNPLTGRWPDLSPGILRAVSPMHLRYLANLGATASMSIALEVDGRLWGLISGHHYTGPRVLEPRVRLAAEVLGRLASAQLAARLGARAAAERRRRDTHRETALAALAVHGDWLAGWTEAAPALLALADADGVAVVTAGGVRRHGSVPSEATVRAIATLGAGGGTEVWACDGLGDEPGLDPGLELGVTAGAMVLGLGRTGAAALVFLRDEWIHTVRWGDNGLAPAADRLSPTGSHRTWSESVGGRARPWSDADREAVAGLAAGVATVVVDQAERLARSNADLEAFAFVIAHDLREPLRNLQSYLDFFFEDHGDGLDPDGRAQLDTVARLAGRMDGLLESLLEHARAERLAPSVVSLSLGEVLEETRALLSPATRRAVIDVQDPDARLWADRDAMVHILTNLFTNAVKYAREDPPRIEVGVMAAGAADGGPATLGADTPVLYVADTGIGIAPEHREAIFELFRRLHARDAFGGGSGAGLAIARRLARRQGGELWLERSVVGEGSRFALSLPRTGERR